MNHCSLCLTSTPSNTAFCSRCLKSLCSDSARCYSCGIEIPTQNSRCSECISHPPEFDRTIVAGRYASPIDQLIHQFKYNGDLHKGRILAEWLLSRLATSRIQLLIPMPLSASRLQERGFNQSSELAQHLSKRLGIPIAHDLLKRNDSMTHQAQLKRQQRLKAMRKEFYTEQVIHADCVALIDDVVTTTATARAAAGTLKKAGVKEVVIWAVARTPRPNDKD